MAANARQCRLGQQMIKRDTDQFCVEYIALSLYAPIGLPSSLMNNNLGMFTSLRLVHKIWLHAQ